MRRLGDEVAPERRHRTECGLAGPSEAIREALAMLHRKAQLVAMGREYDDLYQGEPVPISDVTAALYPDND